MGSTCRIAMLFAACGLLPAQSNWTTPADVEALGYRVKVSHDGCRSQECMGLAPPANPPEQPPGSLMETLDPEEVRGSRVRLRAWVRLERPGPQDRAQLFLRVDRRGNVLGFYDTMGDRPIRSAEWSSYEIVGEVAADAERVSLGVRSFGKSTVWVDSVTVEKLPPPGPDTDAARAALSRTYAALDAAYASGNVDAIAALALPDAEVAIESRRLRLSAVLSTIREQMGGGAKFRSASAITAIRVTGAEAVVWVNNESTVTAEGATRTALSVNRDVWVKNGGAWKLRESTVIAANIR